MTSTMHPTRSARRLSRAGTVAAAAVIALSATVGLGIAPASATPSTTHSDASQVSTASAGDITESKAAATKRFTFTTHWIPVARGGQNVLSFGVVGGDRLVNGNIVPGFYTCVSFGPYQNNLDLVRSVSVVLPATDHLTVGSFSGSDCNGDAYSKVGGTGPIGNRYASWTLFTHHAPAPR